MLAMTNYSKHYASTIYQSLEGAEKKNHVLTKSPKHLPSPSEVKWMAPNIILLQQFLRFFLQDTGSSATNVFQNKARMTVSPETTPRVQIQPVLVYNMNLMEKFQVLERTGFFKESAPGNRYATKTFARDLDRHLPPSESVVSNAAKVTCAVETY